jgi:hypothetical protein
MTLQLLKTERDGSTAIDDLLGDNIMNLARDRGKEK